MRRLFLLLSVVATFLTLAIIGRVAIESVRSSDGGEVISGCYLRGSGQLRIVSSSGECKGSEIPISWNRGGPPGPSGPAGPVRVSHVSAAVSLEPEERASATANCASPALVTGGGFEAPADVDVLESAPAYDDGRLSAWRVTGVNHGTAPVTLRAHAVCALGGTAPTPPSMDLIVDGLTTWSVGNKGDLVAPDDEFKTGDTVAIVARTVDEGGAPLSGSQVFLQIVDDGEVPITSLQGFSDTDGEAVMKWQTPRTQAPGTYAAVVVDVINNGYRFRADMGQTTVLFAIR